jgi:hypothetical protein
MRRLTYIDLVNWSKRVKDQPWRDQTGRAAAKFWAAQTLVTTVLRPTVFDPNYDYPAAVASAHETGAQGLFKAVAVRMLGVKIVQWLIERKRTRIALIESPLGNTVPAQFLEALAKRRGLSAEIVQWNAPRNDRWRLGRTVEDGPVPGSRYSRILRHHYHPLRGGAGDRAGSWFSTLFSFAWKALPCAA